MPVTARAVPKDEQRMVIWLLILENVLDGEIHVRMCVVYGVQNVITKSTVDTRVQRFKVE